MNGEESVREHLRRQYAGVFSEAAIEKHLRAYVGMEAAEELLAYVRQRRPDAVRILDVGCGYGSFVLAARNAGLDAIGIELADFDIAWARGRLVSQRPGDDPFEAYVQGDAHELPFPDASFDVVSLWNVIEHVPNARRVLAEAARVVRPSGSVYVLAPNYASFRKEAHYDVPWFPFLPGRLAVAYLRALNRDPDFYRHDVYPCTMIGTVVAMKRRGLKICDPRSAILHDPAMAHRPVVRTVLRLVVRLRLTSVAHILLRMQLQNPLGATIMLEGIRDEGAFSERASAPAGSGESRRLAMAGRDSSSRPASQ